MFSDYKQAFKEQEERIESGSTNKPVMVGMAAVKTLAINPTEADLKEIIGDVASRFDTKYATSPDQYNDGKPSRTINFWFTDKEEQVSPLIVGIKLVNTPRVSQKGKPQYWIMRSGTAGDSEWNMLSTLWSDEVKVGDVVNKTSASGNEYTETVLKEAKVGEEDYYLLLKNMLKWPDDTTFFEALEKEGLDFDTVFGGDFEGLHKLVTYLTPEVEDEENKVKTFIGLFTARVKNDGRIVQSFAMKNSTWFYNNYGGPTKGMIKAVEQEREKRFKHDGLDIIKDKYALIDHLQPYSDELVKEVAVPNVSAQAAFDDLFE